MSATCRQAGRSADPTILGTIRGMVARDGATGLYKGLSAQLLKTVLVAALMLTARAIAIVAAPASPSPACCQASSSGVVVRGGMTRVLSVMDM